MRTVPSMLSMATSRGLQEYNIPLVNETSICEFRSVHFRALFVVSGLIFMLSVDLSQWKQAYYRSEVFAYSCFLFPEEVIALVK